MKMIRLKSIVPLLDSRECLNMFQDAYAHYSERRKGVIISLEDARFACTDNYDEYILTGTMFVMANQKLTDTSLDIEIANMQEAFVLEYYRRFKHILNPYKIRYKIIKRSLSINEPTICCEYVITLTNRNTNL